jgi:hypothetical protein
MPDGVRRGGSPRGARNRGGYSRGGFPVRERRFPRFFFSPIWPPYNRCDYIDRFGRCCDNFGRCHYDYYGGGYAPGVTQERPASGDWDTARNYGYGERGY